jgi:hypothetical protein
VLYGIYQGPLVIYPGKKEVVVIAPHYYLAADGHTGYCKQYASGSVYLHFILTIV